MLLHLFLPLPFPSSLIGSLLTDLSVVLAINARTVFPIALACMVVALASFTQPHVRTALRSGVAGSANLQ